MNPFKLLKTTNFEYQLKIYQLLASAFEKDGAQLEENILVESTFLQIYATLEEALYYECEQQVIKKKASISRFETALNEQGYKLDNEHWQTLINISKIRNCLLHGNGRLDIDQYGADTKDTLNALNSAANTTLIEIINTQTGTTKIKIKPQFIHYCFMSIKSFIDVQQ